jgi:hypothetical protein
MPLGRKTETPGHKKVTPGHKKVTPVHKKVTPGAQKGGDRFDSQCIGFQYKVPIIEQVLELLQHLIYRPAFFILSFPIQLSAMETFAHKEYKILAVTHNLT